MKIKKEYIILVIVILALSVYLMIQNRDRTNYALPRIAPIERKEISKIEIVKTDTALMIEKKDKDWYLAPEGYPVEKNKAENILDIIEDFTPTALISEAKSFERYELDDKNKITLKAWTGDDLRLEFDLGKTAPSYQHTFVKLAGDHRVFHARGNFRDDVDQTRDDLRDKKIFSFDPSDIRQLHIVKGEESLTCSRKDSAADDVTETTDGEKKESLSKPKEIWVSEDGNAVDSAKLNPLLSTLSDLRCKGYLVDRTKDGFHAPIFKITLTGTKEYTISVFSKTDEKDDAYPAFSSENDYVFTLAEWQAKQIMKSPAELMEKQEES